MVVVAPHLLPEISGQLALCLPDETMVEAVEDASFSELGALADDGPCDRSRCADRRHRAGHGLVFHLADNPTVECLA